MGTPPGSRAMKGIAARLPKTPLILMCGRNETLAAELRALPAQALEEFIGGYIGTSSKRYMSSHLGQLRKLLDEEADHLAAINERLDGWQETSPDKIADREVVEAAGAFARFAFVAAGVTSLMWVNTSSKSCPYCDALDGQIVGIERSFVEGGTTLGAGDETMSVSHNTFHPPLHAGCQCIVVPA